jgi:hypothetical protein
MNGRITGRLQLEVREGGVLVAARRASNVVLRSGASVIAALFAGVGDAAPVDGVGVGFGTEAATPETTALTPPDGEVPAAALRIALTADSFSIATDLAAAVRVSIGAVFKPTVELANVTEAGLLAGDKLYNQVVFEPVTLRPGHDVTFFWEVDFPFGH